MAPIRFTSYNVKGLYTPGKRSRLLADLKCDQSQVDFIQETYFKHDKIPRLFNHYFFVEYHSTADNLKSKGEAILVARNIFWEGDLVIRDDTGAY